MDSGTSTLRSGLLTFICLWVQTCWQTLIARCRRTLSALDCAEWSTDQPTLAPYLLLIYHSTTTSHYITTTLRLYLWAWITGKSFVIWEPGRLPQFISRPWSTDLHVFKLTPEDIYHIYSLLSIHAQTYAKRK